MRLPSLSPNVTSAVKVHRANQILIPAEVQLDCELSFATIFNWEVFHLYSDKVLSKNGSSELLIPRGSLSVGSYAVRLTVTMAGTKVFGVDKGYIRVTSSPIVARIAGGTKMERGFNKTLIFNASLSHDPDTFDPEVRKFNPAFQTPTGYRKLGKEPTKLSFKEMTKLVCTGIPVVQVETRAHYLVLGNLEHRYKRPNIS